MSLLTEMRGKCHSAVVLSVVVIAWLTVLVTPCAMAFISDAPSNDMPSVLNVHGDCVNDKPSKLMVDSGCCCDLASIASNNANAPQPVKLDTLVSLIALPVYYTDFFKPMFSKGGMVRPPPLLYRTSPPIYLSTQRLRI